MDGWHHLYYRTRVVYLFSEIFNLIQYLTEEHNCHADVGDD